MKLDVKELIAKLTNTPMVVEQGTSGIWTYRKWSDGIAECWGLQAFSNLAMTAQETYGYYAPLQTISFPNGLFISTPVVTLGVHEGGALGNFTIGSLTTTQVSGYFWATRSVTKGVTLFIRVEGKWK